MLTLRQRVFVAISIIMAVVLAIVLLFLYRKSQVPTEIEYDGGDQPLQASEEVVSETEFEVSGGISVISPKQAIEPGALYAQNLARVFVERFATYSNQNKNQHIEDVKPLATDRMISWIDTQKIEQNTKYSGVTTDVMSIEIQEQSEEKTIVKINAQQVVRSQVDGQVGLSEEIIQKKARVELIKQAGEWKVDGFFWE